MSLILAPSSPPLALAEPRSAFAACLGQCGVRVVRHSLRLAGIAGNNFFIVLMQEDLTAGLQGQAMVWLQNVTYEARDPLYLRALPEAAP